MIVPCPEINVCGLKHRRRCQVRQIHRPVRIHAIRYRRQIDGLRTYLRLAPPPKVQGRLDLSNFTLADLVTLAKEAFAREDHRPELKTVVKAPRITIREKISQIVQTLRKGGRASFSGLLGNRRTRLDVVVTFLAMLEIVRSKIARVVQKEQFEDILIEATSDNELLQTG